MDQGMPDQIAYHFPKHGRLSIHVGGYTRALADLFETQGQLITRLKQTDQLGNLRYFYPGAHHTRYEYLLLQWYLLDRLAQAKAVSEPTLGLGGGVRDLPKLEGAGPPTGVDLLQTAVLLANVGHLPETLAGERAVLAVLADDQDLCRGRFKACWATRRPRLGSRCSSLIPTGCTYTWRGCGSSRCTVLTRTRKWCATGARYCGTSWRRTTIRNGAGFRSSASRCAALRI